MLVVLMLKRLISIVETPLSAGNIWVERVVS